MTRRRILPRVAAASLAALLTGVVVVDAGTAAPSVTPATGEFAELVPRPVSATAEAGDGFTLSEESTIRASEELEGLATTLADLLEPATGFDVEITSGEAGAGDIRLELVADEAADPESYELVVDDRVRIAAPTPHGLF